MEPYRMLSTISLDLSFILGVLAVSFWLPAFFGAFSVAQVGFMAVGAYAAGILSARYHADLFLSS